MTIGVLFILQFFLTVLDCDGIIYVKTKMKFATAKQPERKDGYMKRLEIATTNEFNESFSHFGYIEFVRKVLQKCAFKKEHGLAGKITLIDAEPSRRVFLVNEQGAEFTVRYFIQECNEKGWAASYTLYKQVPDEGGSHGEEISCGYAISHYIVEPITI